MPYSGANDPSLPKNVLKLSPLRRRQWLHVFNSARDRGRSDGDAIHMANGVTANQKTIDMEDFLEALERLELNMPDDKETAWAPFVDYEAKADGDSGIVEGYASVFGARDHGQDMVYPGAFKKTLEERGQQIIYLPSHDYKAHVKDIPGVPIEIREDTKGLYTKTQFFLNTAAGRDSFTVIKAYQNAKRPLGLSYTFKPREGGAVFTKDGRDLKDLDLYEYGHTALPMLDLARTTSAKSDSNSMIHSTDVDHMHNHGDMIHSHGHVHGSTDGYYGMSHSYHDHTADQLKALNPDDTGFEFKDYNEYVENKRQYSKEQCEEMAKSGKAQPDGSCPIVDEEDLKNAIRSWGLSGAIAETKSHIIKRARSLGKYNLVPDSWRSALLAIISSKSIDLIKDFETKHDTKLEEVDKKKIQTALETLEQLLGHTSKHIDYDENDPEAKIRREIEEMLEKIEL